VTHPSLPGDVIVTKANQTRHASPANDNTALQHRTAQNNLDLIARINSSSGYTSTSAVDLLTANISRNVFMQTTAPPCSQIEGWMVDIFLTYDSLMSKAIAAGNMVKQGSVPWPVLQFRAKSSKIPYSSHLIRSGDITVPAVASFVHTYCAWKGWSLQVGQFQMLEDWRTIQRAFPNRKAGSAKLRKVLHGIASVL
jgi:hypothetical protein